MGSPERAAEGEIYLSRFLEQVKNISAPELRRSLATSQRRPILDRLPVNLTEKLPFPQDNSNTMNLRGFLPAYTSGLPRTVCPLFPAFGVGPVTKFELIIGSRNDRPAGSTRCPAQADQTGSKLGAMQNRE